MTETKLIYAKMAAILRATDAIAKKKKNVSQGFNFRGIDDVMNELHASFAEHGVFLTSRVLELKRTQVATQKGGKMEHQFQRIKFTFHAEDGSSVSSVCWGEAMDTGDKASNKCMSIALKYCLLQAFLIPTEDMIDPDSQTHQTGSGARNPPPVDTLRNPPNGDELYSDKHKQWLFTVFKDLGVHDQRGFMTKASMDVKGMQLNKVYNFLKPQANAYLDGMK